MTNLQFYILFALLIIMAVGFSLAFVHVFNQADHIDCETHVIQGKPC